MKTLRFLFTLLIVWCLPSQASWNPFINNYDRNDYGDGTSTWRIVPIDKWTFFTNEKGLLVFDGVNWSRYPLNSRCEARGIAVFTDSRRVFVGGENEYGYFEVNDAGIMVYHCLSEKVGKKYRQIGNVWEIYQLNGSLYLRCDDHVLVISGNNYSLINSDYKIFASIMMGGIIYVATDHGLYMIVGERLLSVEGAELLNGKRINSMIPYGHGMIVTTATDGLYYYDGHRAEPFATPADPLLKRSVICCAASRGNLLALGTIHNGLIVVDTATGEVRTFNEKRGMQNNTVLSVAFDQDGNLWAGLSYGIDHILLEDPFTYLYRTPNSYGIGYCSEIFDGRFYFGTDRGVYSTSIPVTFSEGEAVISHVDCPSGPAWAMYKNRDELFCMHDKGLFSIKGNTATKVTDILGVWACQAVEGHPDIMLVGGYCSMYVIKKMNGTWVLQGEIEGIDVSCRYFRQSGKRQITVYNRNLGTAIVYQLSASLMRVESQKEIMEEDPNFNGRELDQLFGNWNVTGKVLQLDSTRQIVPFNKGFVFLDQNKSKGIRNVFITKIFTTYPSDSLIYSANFCNVKSEPRIAYANNSVRIEYQVPALHAALAAKYQYRLNGGEWSPLSDNTSKEYSNLREGTYTFEVRAEMKNGSVSTDSITFLVLPPWYRTIYAYFVYALIFAALLVWLYKMENRRIRKKESMAVEEKNKEVNQMKVEIDKLEKEKMDLDLMHKSQEIANLVASVGRKNETMAGLKEQIKQVATRIDRDNAIDCKRQLLTIMNSIDSNMEGDEILKKFEEQFDQANNHFMQKLRSRHTDLNQNEIMMCAYLKMNLSTKEIAPLLNLSVRGVETIRYRLRKKFGLEREDNLVVYLNNIQETN